MAAHIRPKPINLVDAQSQHYTPFQPPHLQSVIRVLIVHATDVKNPMNDVQQ
jgi:hypothetical protein